MCTTETTGSARMLTAPGRLVDHPGSLNRPTATPEHVDWESTSGVAHTTSKRWRRWATGHWEFGKLVMRARLLHLLQLVGVMLLLLVTAQSALAQNPDADNTLIAADWQFANLSVEPTQPTVGDVAIIRFRVHDHNGFPVEDLRVIGKLRAPVTNYGGEAPDPIITSVGRAEERAGAYMVAVALNQAGRWWVDITVTDPDGQGATMSQFLVVAPTLGTPPATTDSPLFLRGDS